MHDGGTRTQELKAHIDLLLLANRRLELDRQAAAAAPVPTPASLVAPPSPDEVTRVAPSTAARDEAVGKVRKRALWHCPLASPS